MANTPIPLYDDKIAQKGKAQTHLKDPSLDLGENSPEERTTQENITPQKLEEQVDVVQAKQNEFAQTGLHNPEEKYLDTKTYQQKEDLTAVQHAQIREKPEASRERILEKLKITFDAFIRDFLSTRKRYPEILAVLGHSLESKSIGEKREQLEELLTSIQQLRTDLTGLAPVYFAQAVRMLKEFKLGYKDEFGKTMKPRLEEYYLQFGHSTNNVPHVDSFSEVLLQDIHDVTSGKYGLETISLEKLEKDVTRLITLLKNEEEQPEASSVVQNNDQMKRQEEAEELTTELQEQVDIIEQPADDHEQTAQAA